MSLTQKQLEPYKVIKGIGYHGYGPDVPKGKGWHNVIRSTLFEPLRRRDKPQDMYKHEEVIWEVEDIINSRRIKGVVQYYMRLTCCTEVEDIQEMFDHLHNCAKKLQKVQQKLLRKPQDNRDVSTLLNIYI